MFKKYQNHTNLNINLNVNLNVIFTAFLLLCIDVSKVIFLAQPHQKAEAQGEVQVRTKQGLKVEKVVGNVKYRNLYNYDNRPAKVGDRLQTTTDEISTGSNGSAVLSIDTGIGSIYVAENTTIQIRSFRVAADNGQITNLFIPRGKARLQVRKFTNRGSQLNIETPAGISGVRGTSYIVAAKSNGSMAITTLEGSVATTAQNQTKMVNGGFQNLTFVGEPPSTALPINNDTGLKYSIIKQASNLDRFVIFSGHTSPFNTVKVNGLDQPLDRNGKFSLQLPATSNLDVRITVENSTGKIQFYNIPLL